MANLRNKLFNDRKDLIVFLVGCFSTFYIDFIGRIYVGELMIFLLYIIYPKTRIKLSPKVKKLVILMLLWLVSAIITDIYRETPLLDMIKGVTSQIFLVSLVPFAYWALYDKISRWLVFYFGSVVSSQLTYYLIFSQTEFGSSDVWMTYSYISLFIGITVYVYWKGNYLLSYVLLVSIGVWGLFGGSRNAFLICVISAILLYNLDKSLTKNSNSEHNYNIQYSIKVYQNKLVRLVFALLVGLFVISSAYEFLAVNGILGEKAYVKYSKQKDSDVGLASSRLPTIMDIDLITKSPIIGYGSFAKDYTGYVEKYYIEHNIEYQSSRFNIEIDSVENMLPRHSRMFGLWMWHGIGAGIFWIYILHLFFRTLKNGCFLLEPKLLCLSVYTFMMEFWNNLFSPMAERIPPIFFWVFLILINEQYKQLYANKKRKTISINSHSQL